MVTVTTAQRVPRLVGFAVATIWLVLAVTVGALVAPDVELGRIGRADLRSLHGATWVILAAIGSSSVVGSVLACGGPGIRSGGFSLGSRSLCCWPGRSTPTLSTGRWPDPDRCPAHASSRSSGTAPSFPGWCSSPPSCTSHRPCCEQETMVG